MNRTRTYGRADPIELAMAGRVTDGLEFTRQLVTGEQGPIPIFSTLGYQVTELRDPMDRLVAQGTASFMVFPPN
jgi:hypothetical protein